MKKTITIATSHIDRDGDTINLNGLIIPASLILTKNCDPSLPFGLVENIRVECDELKADITLPCGNIGHMFPVIGFQVIKFKLKDGKRHVEVSKLLSVSLCDSPNTDEQVLSLNNQLGAKPAK